MTAEAFARKIVPLRGAALYDFRLYYFDAEDHIREAIVLKCEGEEEAVGLAVAKSDGRAMELWMRDHLVRRFPLDPGYRPPGG